MAMIQGIDGSALLQAFRAGREDRYANDKRRREMEDEEAERARKEQFSGLVGQLFGGQRPSGVAEQYGAQPEAQPQTFGEAFNPETMGAISRGENPDAPTNIPEMPTEAPRRTPNPEVLAQLVALDPETGSKIVTALKSMQDMDLESAEQRNSYMGATARWLRKFPAAERASRLQSVAPMLIENGFTAEQIGSAARDLSDEMLAYIEAHAHDYDTMFDNELAEREANRPKHIAVQGGGNVLEVDPVTGISRWVVGGGPEGGGEAPIRVQSVEEARALPPGTRFIDPNGVERIVPGGPTGSAPSAPFPG